MGDPPTVFISYSHRDRAYKDRLVVHLSSPPLRGLFSAWDDAQIRQGDRWKERIQEAMDQAVVAVLLISADFLASPFIQEVEGKRLCDRQEEEGLVLLPVIVKPCLWRRIDWLDETQAYPRDDATLSGADREHERERHYASICEEIARYVVDQPRTDEDAVEAGEEPPQGSEVPVAAPWATQPLEDSKDLYTEHGVRWFMASVLEGRAEQVVDVVKLLATTKQRTWLAATNASLYCILDDHRTRAGDRLIQWTQPLAQAARRVRVRPSSRYKRLGLVDIGNRKNWLYSLSLWEKPTDLEQRIVRMLEHARQS